MSYRAVLLVVASLCLPALNPAAQAAPAGKAARQTPPAIDAALQQLASELDRSESLRISRLPAGDSLRFQLVSERRALGELAQAAAPQQAWAITAQRQGGKVRAEAAWSLPLAPLRELLGGERRTPNLNRASYEVDLQLPRAQQLAGTLLPWLLSSAGTGTPALLKQLDQHAGIEVLALTSGTGPTAKLARLWLVPDSVQLDIRNDAAVTSHTGRGGGSSALANGTAAGAAAGTSSGGGPAVTVTPTADGGASVTFDIDPSLVGPPPTGR